MGMLGVVIAAIDPKWTSTFEQAHEPTQDCKKIASQK